MPLVLTALYCVDCSILCHLSFMFTLLVFLQYPCDHLATPCLSCSSHHPGTIVQTVKPKLNPSMCMVELMECGGEDVARDDERSADTWGDDYKGEEVEYMLYN